MFIVAFYLMKKFAKKGPVPPAPEQPETDITLIDLETKGANA
jgi:cytochrome d ubiquinol oxidase subunit I